MSAGVTPTTEEVIDPIYKPLDVSKLPPIMPVNVRRVTEDGKPTKHLIDWEQYTRDFYAVGIQQHDDVLDNHEQRIRLLKSKTDTTEATVEEIDRTKATPEEAEAISEKIVRARITDGTIASEASVRTTLQAYATLVEARGIAETEINTRITDGRIVSSTFLSTRLEGYSTLTQSKATAETVVTARIQSGEIVNSATLTSRLSAYTTFDQARSEASTAITASLNNGQIQAKLSTEQIANVDAAGNMKVRYSVTGQVGGQYGGWTLTGVALLGGGATYTLDIQANVHIHGSLTLDGTLTHYELVKSAATQVAGQSGWGAAVAGLVTRAGASVLIHAHRKADDNYASTTGNNAYQPSWYPPAYLTIEVDGHQYDATPINTDTFYTYNNFFAASGGAVSFSSTLYQRRLSTSLFYVLHNLNPGSHTFVAYDRNTSGTVGISVVEYLR